MYPLYPGKNRLKESFFENTKTGSLESLKALIARLMIFQETETNNPKNLCLLLI